MPRGTWLRGLTIGSLLACGGTPGAESVGDAEQPATSASAEPVSAADDSTTATPVVYVEGAFPHRAHAGVECTVCHGAMPGHVTHGLTRCTECHVPPSAELAGRPAPAECAACHHAAEQSRPCTHCHAPSGQALPVHVTFRVAGREADVQRNLSFEHARHGDVECRTCHTGDGTLAVTRECASCHVDHHAIDSSCSTCHAPAPLRTHEADAHRTCAGAGCHAVSAALATPGPRTVCLVCHREQVDHEPGGECRDCHLVTGTGP